MLLGEEEEEGEEGRRERRGLNFCKRNHAAVYDDLTWSSSGEVFAITKVLVDNVHTNSLHHPLCACVHVCSCVCMCAMCMEEGGGENSFIPRTRLSELLLAVSVILYLLCELMRDEWLCVLA